MCLSTMIISSTNIRRFQGGPLGFPSLCSRRERVKNLYLTGTPHPGVVNLAPWFCGLLQKSDITHEDLECSLFPISPANCRACSWEMILYFNFKARILFTDSSIRWCEISPLFTASCSPCNILCVSFSPLGPSKRSVPASTALIAACERS